MDLVVVFNMIYGLLKPKQTEDMQLSEKQL